MNRNFVREFSRELDFPAEAEAALLAAADAVQADTQANAVMERELHRYFSDETHNLYDSFFAVQAAAKPLPVETGTVELLFYILCAEHLRTLYAQAGYTPQMYRDAMIDLRCKLFECHQVKGFWGSFVDYWYNGFYSLSGWHSGRLQFERCTRPPAFARRAHLLCRRRKGDQYPHPLPWTAGCRCRTGCIPAGSRFLCGGIPRRYGASALPFLAALPRSPGHAASGKPHSAICRYVYPYIHRY